MKVAVWVNEEIDKQVGGGFSYTNRLIELIDDRVFSKELEIVFISRKPIKSKFKKEVLFLKSKSIFKTPRYLKLVMKFCDKIKLNSLSKRIENRIKIKVNEDEIEELNRFNIDVIYYLFQTMQSVSNFPFITTNWDLGHLSMYAFPEVSDLESFNNREIWYNISIKRAVSVFVESESGKKELIKYLNINENRIKVVPIFPSKVVSISVNNDEQETFLSRMKLRRDNYFFYPAQFWAHKNHYNLIKGFKLYVQENNSAKLVFTGSDKGNLDYILNLIEKEGLKDNVIYLGFVKLEEMYTLYNNALAMIIPTFLGPTNMPLLEARALNCPVLCSDFEGHREQVGDGALYFNPLQINEIYDAMIEISDDAFRSSLLNNAKVNLISSNFKEEVAINKLEKNLVEVSNYRNCWH